MRHVCSSSMTRRPPGAPLFPYTTLFRSLVAAPSAKSPAALVTRTLMLTVPVASGVKMISDVPPPLVMVRSEEHTSELQSHSDLVCRLLLEKKKKTDREGTESAGLVAHAR